ncbi:ornithine carbamoyltransferase [Campylobacter suis]|uniref:Ornithine carbamoyltransferase n=1 Tax=Campylobacter suis TaxID=2790657 RepID=A0ABM8Q2H5_9BACT|nr:ornithine carbamoyltransferase [Campylobacter suis]CAD7287018.1 hypothetical protein LMG8286_00655 [Campylobacter suis]
MKISFECECIMLQKSLLLFCKEFISPHKECDFVVSDTQVSSQKPVFLIGSHINLPFSKQNLLNALEEFYSAIQIKQPNFQIKGENFEAKLDVLLANFKNDLIALVKAES